MVERLRIGCRQGLELRHQRQRDALQHGIEQIKLVLEMPVNCATRQPRLQRHRLQRGAAHAAALEHALGRVQNLVAGRECVGFGAAGHGG